MPRWASATARRRSVEGRPGGQRCTGCRVLGLTRGGQAGWAPSTPGQRRCGWLGRGSGQPGPDPGAGGAGSVGQQGPALGDRAPCVSPAGTYPCGHSDRQWQQQQRCEEEDGEGPVPQQGPQARRGHLLRGDTVRARAGAAPAAAALSTGRRGRGGRDVAGGDATRPRPGGDTGPARALPGAASALPAPGLRVAVQPRIRGERAGGELPGWRQLSTPG